jgi:hypothetical protein
MSSIEVLVASVANALIAGAIGLLFFGNFFKAAALGFAGSFVALAIVVAIAVQVRRFRERSRGRPRSTRA